MVSCSAVSVHVTICFVYFISLKTYGQWMNRRATSWLVPRFWEFCAVHATDKALHVCLCTPKFQKKPIQFSNETNHKKSYLYWCVWVPNWYFYDGLIATHLITQCIVKWSVSERLNNYQVNFPFTASNRDEPYYLLVTLAFKFTTRLAESWTLQIFDTRVDFPVPSQSRGWLFFSYRSLYFSILHKSIPWNISTEAEWCHMR